MTSAYETPGASAYESGVTSWLEAGSEGVAPAPEPASAPEDMPADAWGMVEYLAIKAAKTCVIEREIADVYASRATVSKRLADAFRRKDDVMASKCAQDWIRSEVRLHDLFSRYAVHVRERDELIESLTHAQTPAIHTGP